MSINFVITSPPYKRKRKIDGTYMMITEDKDWVMGTVVYEYTTGGCFQYPENGTYNTQDGYSIVVEDTRIKSISQTNV